jgi:hypothetical protein
MATKFPSGRLLTTPGAMEVLGPGATALVDRHLAGDWGDCDAADRKANDDALANGERVFSAYETPAGRVWIITEADRSTTTVMLPEEY